MDVRREAHQIHDLGEPGSRHMPQPRQFCLIRHDTVADQLVKPNSQGHQTRDAGNTPSGGRGRRFALSQLLPRASPLPKSDKATVLSRIQDLTKLVLAGAEFSDIRQYAAERDWKLSERQLRRYQEMVYEKLAESTQRNRDQLLGRHLMQRRALYARAVKASDFRAALMILKDEAELEALYPPTKIAPTSPDGTLPYTPGFVGPKVESALTRRQRVVKRINALANKDREELKLLRQVTPKQMYLLRDTMLPEQMLYVLALQHITEQLDRAGMYLFASWSATIHGGEDPDGFLEFLLATNSYLFKVGHDGWKLFGEQTKVNTDWLIHSNYRGALLAIANENLLKDVPDADYVRHVMASHSNEPVGELTTAEAEAKRWRQMFRKVCREPKSRPPV